MKKTIYFQYDTRKHSLFYHIVRFNLLFIPIYIFISAITNVSIIPMIIFLSLESLLIYSNLNIILFEYKFTKYYENLIVQRMHGEDVDTLKNPLIKLIFEKKGLTISFYEFGYFNNEEYEKIGRAIERFARFDFEHVYMNPNETNIEFLNKREAVDYNHEDEKTSITLDSRLEWEPTIHPNLFLTGSTGSGKTACLNYFVGQFQKKGYKTIYLDPKGEYISESELVIVEYSKNNILKQLRLVNEELEARQQNKTPVHGQIFVVIEEMSALKATLNKEELKEFDKYFQNILFKGRSLKITLIVVAQVADSELFGSSGIREQFNLRISLGTMTTTRCKMVFDMPKKDLPPTSKIIGSGYLYLNGRVYSYTAPRLSYKDEPSAELDGSGTIVKRLKGAINR